MTEIITNEEIDSMARARGLAPSRLRFSIPRFYQGILAYRFRIGYVVSRKQLLEHTFWLTQELLDDDVAAAAIVRLSVDESLHRFLDYLQRACTPTQRAEALRDMPRNLHGQTQGRSQVSPIFAVAKLRGGESA